MDSKFRVHVGEVCTDGMRAAKKLFSDLVEIDVAAAHPEDDVELSGSECGEVVWRGTSEFDGRFLEPVAVADGSVFGSRERAAAREVGIGDKIKLGRAQPEMIA